jgi:hypothetical protein
MIGPRKKCCGQEYYSKKTHHCPGGRHVLPIYTELCGTAEYDTRKQKCCDRKLYNVSKSSTHYKCCGSSLYNDIEQKATIYICHIKKLHYFTYDIWKTIILILINMVGMCFIITLRKLQIFLYRYEGPDSIISLVGIL